MHGGRTIDRRRRAALDSRPGRRGSTKSASIAEVATRAAVVMRELRNRVGYLLEVGLGYLTVERQARTLSGGEAQRIHLASALGSVLVGTFYALDEPTVGLHAADARRLLAVLYSLRDFGNTVVVVEHDPAMIAGADHVVELGPGGGSEGGELTYSGPPAKATSRQHGVVAGTRAADARAGEAAQIHQARSRDSNRRRARAQSRRHRRGDPGRADGLRDRSFRIGKIDAGRGRALQQLPAPHRRHLGRARRVRANRRPRADRRDGAYGAGVADALDAIESGDLSENLRRHPQAVRRQSRGAAAGRAGAAFFVQRHRRAMREMQRHRHRHDRDAFHGGPRGEMRRVRRPPLPEPYSRDQAAQLEYQPGARSHRRGRARVFHPSSRDRQAARRADRGRPRLHSARADDLDAVRRRGAAPQARALSAGRSRTGAGGRRRRRICRGCSSSTSRPPGSARPTSSA